MITNLRMELSEALVPELQLATAAIAARLSENRGGGGDLFLARDGGGDVISQVSHCKLRFESLL